MLKHEKIAFWKFFLIYFGSVALLILASGYFYFLQQEKGLLEKEHFSMIEYIKNIKMSKKNNTDMGISYSVTNEKIENFNMNNFEIKDEYFEVYLPYSWSANYYKVRKDKRIFYEKLEYVKFNIILVQFILLALFASISYFLSASALKPMQNALTKLDNFSKDFIHDLNTPITSILLNMKLIESKEEFQNNKYIERIKHSIEDIGALHSNLTLLLQEDNMVVKEENIMQIVQDVVEIQSKIYQGIYIEVMDEEFIAIVNRDALKQVLLNIISNSCKYNKKDGYVKVYKQGNTLCIEDGGMGIKEVKNIFERSYKEHQQGHGIGLDIVKRLCDVMDIKIEVASTLDEGTTVFLNFKY